MNYNSRVFSVCLAILACNGWARADQFGLLTANPLAAWSAPAEQPPPLEPAAAMPAPPAAEPAPAAPVQHDWLGRRISFDTAAAGPETQIGNELACDECCLPPWAHRSGLFAEAIYLRPRDAEVAYAVPIDGAIVPQPGIPPIQIGPIAVADPDYSPGFRLGGVWAFDECSSVALTYSRFESSTNDTVSTNAPLVLRSLVLHPGTTNAGSDFLDARAASDVDFDLVDLDYRAVWDSGDLYAINYLVGLRYARLNQDFTGVFGGTGTTDTLLTNSNFDGAGLKLGLDAERHAQSSGLFVYGRTNVSFIAGDARTRYRQFSDVDPLIVNTTWKAGRIVTILDLEIGAGWQSTCGRWRINGGYLFNSWYNVVPTDQWIRSVQRNDFVGLGDEITFDGFTFRVTYNW